MPTKTGTNGQATKAQGSKAVAKVEKKLPVTNVADEFIKKLVLLEERSSRLSELQTIMDDYNKVTETLKGLDQFKGVNGESVQFTIADLTSDANFTTYNSNLVRLVIETLKDKLKTKNDQLVDQILNFEM